jgi:soluble lytic murein transglycosylase-like protein
MCAAQGAGYVDISTDEIDHLAETPAVELAEPAVRPPDVPVNSPLPIKDAIDDMISKTAARYQLDRDFVASVVRAESGFNPQALSPKGAQGLMQLMPQTAATLGVENVFDPAANLDGGTKYLRQLLEQYNGDVIKALAAYNAGPGRVQQYGGIPPYRETWAYVTRIIEDYNRAKLRQQAGASHDSGAK